ncbi:Uncharacterised protein [Porphyromonas cangingivalis]|nr:hypothetical protein [Porphyromonas cangingivalis]SPY34668.1 Uncharacterised protein [Porphyromonas cangingivalis]
MKRYTSERVDALLNKMDDELPVLKAIKRQKALEEAWTKIPDKTLRQLEIKATIDSDGVLILMCTSAVALDYVKRQRRFIEKFLFDFMLEWGLSQIRMTLE